MKHRADEKPDQRLTPVDATVGAATEAFWRIREHGAGGHPVPDATRERAPVQTPGASQADQRRRVMRQPGRAAGGRRFK